MAAFAIGRLAELTGIKVTTIRYYEAIGLLPEPPRTEGNRRSYGPEHVERLRLVRRSRELGLPMEAIRDLLALSQDPTQPCEPAVRIVELYLTEIDRKIGELTALKTRFRAIIDQCRGSRVETCTILKALHDGADTAL